MFHSLQIAVQQQPNVNIECVDINFLLLATIVMNYTPTIFSFFINKGPPANGEHVVT